MSFQPGYIGVRLGSALFYSMVNAACEFLNCFNYRGHLIAGTAK